MHRENEFRSINSQYLHLDFLVAQILFDLEEYEKAFAFFSGLDAKGFLDKRHIFKNLYQVIREGFL